MKGVVRDLAAGAVAGTAATVPMSMVMWAAQKAGLMGEQPPAKITKSALYALGFRPSAAEEDQLSIVNHLLFGAVTGGLFGLGRRALPSNVPALPAGVVFGLAVWFSAYEGLIPALQIMPRADEDRPGRAQSMAAAHVVFGVALASVLRRLRA